MASAWAERLVGITRRALEPQDGGRGHFHGTTACLAALYRAERFPEILDVLGGETFWHYARWRVKALGALGRVDEALMLAESLRGPWTSSWDVNVVCEELLLQAGRVEDAYTRYAIGANGAGTYLSTFRAIAKKYSEKPARQILADLVKSTPGEEGKWFATAKELELFDVAIELARRSGSDPRTLARAAHDHAADRPAFAVEAGFAALHWLALGFGYEITSADVWSAYLSTMKAAEALGRAPEVKTRLRELVLGGPGSGFVAQILGRELAAGR